MCLDSVDWSSPDIYVKVRRRDLEVTEMIRRTKDMLSVLGDRKTAVEKELELLRIKKQNSELVPGEPLSSNQLESPQPRGGRHHRRNTLLSRSG